MSKINDGGPAFPLTWQDESQDHLGQMIEAGLTKREYFAGLAMQALITQLPENSCNGVEGASEIVGRGACVIADALIAELEKNSPAPHDIASGEIG